LTLETLVIVVVPEDLASVNSTVEDVIYGFGEVFLVFIATGLS
jgi:hypothetical protein